jgi:hypothetical protein
VGVGLSKRETFTPTLTPIQSCLYYTEYDIIRKNTKKKEKKEEKEGHTRKRDAEAFPCKKGSYINVI